MHKRYSMVFWLMILITFSLSVNSVVFAATGNKLDFYQLENYIIPSSNKVVLSEKDLYELSAYSLDIARNEIFARHGYVFKNESYADYFSTMPWYKKNSKFKESMLSSIEKKNTEFIRSYVNKLRSNFKEVKGKNITIDLNGDGIKENIALTCTTGSDKYSLKVNKASISGTGDNLDGVMYIADIDTKDKYKEIAITESGPSADYNTYFYYYNGSRLIFMGKVQGSDFSIKASGTGSFTTKTRGSILQTWFYTDEYKLNSDHTLSNLVKKYYKMNTIITVKKPLKLQKSPTDPAVATTLKAGEKVLLSDTDNKKWCAIETSGGIKGWFNVEPFDKIEGISASEYFDGLSYAD
ncbi:MAG: hypothetical protein K0R50_878 [Eubacterium sp.]|nr:hypothetical protein [Eubacterium sp.]